MHRILMALAAVSLIIPQGHAQTLYRCGSTYQDRPCEGSVAGTAVGTANVRPPATAVKADTFCTQQGADAIKIMWMKEGGKTELEQTTDTVGKGGSAEFVHYVYGKRGSATEVRALIETDCMADKERKAQAAKLSAAASALAGQTPPASTAPSAPAASAAPPLADTPSATNTKPAKEDLQIKNDMCKSLREQVNSVKVAQRTGGSTTQMESFNQQMRDIDGKLRSLGCS